MPELELVWDADCHLTECPVWDPDTQWLYFADLINGRLFGCHRITDERRTWSFGQRIGSFGLCTSGRLVIALTRTVGLFDLDSETVTLLTAEFNEPRANWFNDGKVGPDGCFWVGTRDSRKDLGPVENGNAGLYRVTPDGTITRRASGYVTSNGLAWSPDGQTLYHSDSTHGTIDAWDFAPDSGTIAARRRLATCTRAEGLPDGGACDAEGSYWSAGTSAACLNRFGPSGALLNKIEFGWPQPTMPCFADGELYITSVRKEDDRAESRNTFNLGGLFRMAHPGAGAPVYRFADT
jgi:sugar lactone lactonase YvrE